VAGLSRALGVKIALLVAYDGTGFRGFARQRSVRTVQGVLEERLSLLLRAHIETTGAGRTDAGVHAWGQVMSFVCDDTVDPRLIRDRVNKMLAPEIVVRAAVPVPESFDARFSATRREYEYRVLHSDTPDPFLDRFVLWVPSTLSIVRMRAGARALIGEHDFSSFCRRGQASLVRRLRAVTIVSAGDLRTFKVKADSFCHQMVRSIVGLLLDVGMGKRSPEEVAAVLEARDRAAAGRIAAAKGLHLVRVRYRPDPFSAVQR